MPDIATDMTLTAPPDMEYLESHYPWIFRANMRTNEYRYLLLYMDHASRSTQPEIYSYGRILDRIAGDVRYWSHRGNVWGVWDCEAGEYVTGDATGRCTCTICRIRGGGTVEAECAYRQGDFTLSMENRSFDWCGDVLCSQGCLDEFRTEQALEEARANGCMRNYSWKPTPNFLRVDDAAGDDEHLFFGFELELPSDNRTRLSTAVYEGPGQAERVLYCKDDSSIYGAEVVSHPMTHRYFREFLDIQGLFSGDVARHVDGTPETGYGLHVHVSRAGFKSQAHALRWLLLIYRNADEMAKLSRRTSGQWSSFRDLEECEEKARRIGAGDRYTAVNAQNSYTFEVRCFRSTYDEQEFRAAVDFCHASVVYTRSLNNNGALKGDALTWGKFRAWVDARPEYEHLTNELRKLETAPVPADPEYDEDESDDDSDYDDTRCTCASCRTLRARNVFLNPTIHERERFLCAF